jgi:hypothetical protein
VSPTTRSEDAPRFPGRRVPAKAALVHYRYGSIRILRDGRVRYDARTYPEVHELDFSVSYVFGLGDGTYREDKRCPTIYARMPGNNYFFIIHVEEDRVQSTCFSFGLTPEELREGIALLLKARGGLERWVVPGLEWTARSLTHPGANNPTLIRACRAAIRSLRKRLVSAKSPLPSARGAAAG